MDKETRDKRFIRNPIFKGGNGQYRKFIKSNLKYPKAAKEKKIEGVVIVRYEINHKGKVVHTKVISSLGHGCDEEAVRVVKLFQFDIPKGPRKLKVTFHKTVRINFRLPKKKKQSFQYQISASTGTPKSTTKQNKPSAPKTYEYTISW